jgi:hypothetical protein
MEHTTVLWPAGPYLLLEAGECSQMSAGLLALSLCCVKVGAFVGQTVGYCERRGWQAG